MCCCIGYVIIIKNEGSVNFGNARILETNVDEQAEETASGAEETVSSEEDVDTAILTGRHSKTLKSKKPRRRGKAVAGLMHRQKRKR
ncbi:hypothetical protein FHS16_001068 [Paenibacillus endophyticus]|uniref:Uncharacterized protein n=1 Tax=Paenibacillus endophyticus TaxID=1294268 RepID=A0A7W5C5F6_9BACL|nr:hypothetical protein [Paenibacillus endophyticus]